MNILPLLLVMIIIFAGSLILALMGIAPPERIRDTRFSVVVERYFAVPLLIITLVSGLLLFPLSEMQGDYNKKQQFLKTEQQAMQLQDVQPVVIRKDYHAYRTGYAWTGGYKVYHKTNNGMQCITTPNDSDYVHYTFSNRTEKISVRSSRKKQKISVTMPKQVYSEE